MGRVNYVLSSPGFVVDPESVSLNSGRQIDWTRVGAAFGADGEKRVPAGTVMAELDSGLIVPRTEDYTAAGAVDPLAAAPAGGILVADAHQKANSDSKSGYGVYVGGVFYEQLLPDVGDADFSDFKTELGSRFVFDKYEDSRGA